MKILNKIISNINTGKKNQSKTITVSTKLDSKNNKNRQKLFEHWCKKEKWLLFNEGIPLLYAVDPEKKNKIPDELVTKIEKLASHAKECVKNNLLPVINNDQSEKKWEVKPINLFSWATVSRVAMPDEFVSLMSFINLTVKQINNFDSNENTNSINHVNREITLGAAISILVNAPNSSRNANEHIDSISIVQEILKNEKHWFKDTERKLSEAEMVQLINEYLKFSKPLYLNKI